MRLVLTLDGRPPDGLAGEAVFGPAGGTIGRASSSSWVLRDGARSISARHAGVTFENGRFFLVDTSSNGILYTNGSGGTRAVGRSNRVQLSSGDRFSIGPFGIAVRVEDEGSADLPEMALAGRRPVTADASLGDAPGPASVGRIDPLAAFMERPAVPPGAPAIPDDFDPLAELLGPRPAAAPVAAAVPTALAPTALAPTAPATVPPPAPITPPSVAPSSTDLPRIVPSPDGTGIGGRIIQPEARRAAPVVSLGGAEAAALAGFWRGLNVGPPPAGPHAAMAEALGQALAAVLDRGLGDEWRHALYDGDPAALWRIAGTLEDARQQSSQNNSSSLQP